MMQAKATAGLPAVPPLWLLVLITISGTLAMHMFVPALPDAAHDLRVDGSAMQLTISVYIVGLALGQLAYGPLSDAYGRRPLLLIGLGLYTAGGLAAALAPNLHVLLVARLVQALGGCAGLALGRAIVRDAAPPEEAVRELALLNLMMMVGPGLAPLLGAGLVTLGGWRGIFVLLTLLGAATMLCSWRLLAETGRPGGVFSVARLRRDYATLLRSPRFLGFAIGGGCATTGIYAFIAAAPFILAGELHRPPAEVGICLGLLIVGMSAGNALTRRLVGTVGIERLLLAGNAVSVLAGGVFLGVVLGGQLNDAWIVGCTMVFALGAGASSPAALGKAMDVDAALVGSSAGLYGCIQMAVGALCTVLTGWGHDTALVAALVMLGAASVGQLGFWLGLSRSKPRAMAQ